MFSTFFQKLGLDDNEQLVFIELYKLGAQPASVVARHLQMERTTVYKVLLRLAKMGFVSVSEKDKTKHFHIPDSKVLQRHIQSQKQKYTDLENDYLDIEQQFRTIKTSQKSYLPKIRIFDNVAGIQHLYDDILATVKEKQIMTIKFFASNVFDEQVKTNPTTKEILMKFFAELQKSSVNMDTTLGNGIMIMEHISKTSNIDLDSLSFLPAGNSAINIFAVGDSLYIVIFKDTPFGIKIESEELVYSMHFLLDNLQTK